MAETGDTPPEDADDPDVDSLADPEEPVLEKRICVNCGNEYEIDLESGDTFLYVDPPWDWRSGCATHCLACWLCDDWFKSSPDEAPAQIDDDDDVPF